MQDDTTNQCGRCNECSEIIVNRTCYDAKSESEHGHDANESGFNVNYYETGANMSADTKRIAKLVSNQNCHLIVTVELAYNSDYYDISSTSSYLSNVSNFSALEIEFGPLDEEERTSEVHLRESDMSDVLTSYFHDGNRTLPPSTKAQTNLWGVGARDSSDSEKEPFFRTRKLNRTWEAYCQSPRK